MPQRPTVLGALRVFLPEFQKSEPALSPQQRRAIWALTHCRTSALGGRAFVCQACDEIHFAYHSCNHKACPQCGAVATRRWVARELHKRVNAPYFLVTFTLPSELRGCFFGPFAKLAYDLFFTAVHAALTADLSQHIPEGRTIDRERDERSAFGVLLRLRRVEGERRLHRLCGTRIDDRDQGNGDQLDRSTVHTTSDVSSTET